ncbi:MAG TPA: glycosyltransferase family 4 protein [Acidimicrobiales bacterium]|nr:glycosyltransferase family 4 protein [Acidimicrobiales bacterium]
MHESPRRLRIAFLAYRGNPHSGGQGVYTRYLTRELTALGHHVEVLAGPPYPILDDGVPLVEVPSLDLYRQPDPFRIPHPREVRSRIDVLEFALMCTAGFPEPLTFSLRARKVLAGRRDDFDIVHDNQCLGRGLLGMIEDGWPIVATVHHPITVDRDLELAHAHSLRRRLILRRWYGFVGMQLEVTRQLPRVVTVSASSKSDIVEHMGAEPSRVSVVPVGVDDELFRPLPGVARVPGRLMTTASADVPLKGLVPLLEALAKVRTERSADLVVIGEPRSASRVGATIKRLGLEDAVRFVSKVSDERLVQLYAEAEVAVVPSLYEGFSLPAIEAMACGVPVVATTGGALPEVVGADGVTGLLVPPGDPGALAMAIGTALDQPGLRARIGAAGRARVLERFTWAAAARATVEQYRAVLGANAPADDLSGRPPGPARDGIGGI